MFDNGQFVYVKTDPYQRKGVITSITALWNGGIVYEVAFGADYEEYQAIELSEDKDLAIQPLKLIDE